MFNKKKKDFKKCKEDFFKKMLRIFLKKNGQKCQFLRNLKSHKKVSE